jgi:post-segregation antitoxin (ccd killing protein)
VDDGASLRYYRFMTTLEITLSDDIARKASAEGLLTSARLEEILDTEIRKAAVVRLRAHMERMRAVPGPEMSMDEINAEVKAVRRERREKREAAAR